MLHILGLRVCAAVAEGAAPTPGGDSDTTPVTGKHIGLII
jgi:hypothetical protein